MRKLFALLFLCALVHPHSWAGTINAASASQSDVQTAVNSASDGDTVQVPVGAATWNSGVSWTDKNITLAGTSSCTGITPGCAPVTTTSNSGTATVITCNVSPCITVNLNTKPFRITGFWFNRAVSSGIIIQISQGSTFLDTKVNGIRIDHNFFDDHLQGSGNDVAMNGYTYGVQDHNTFFVILGDQSTLLTENGVGESDANINALSGSKSWARANTLGTADAWYFEDNIFSVGDATGKTWFNPIVGDGTAGNVFVVRHNYFCGGAVETHGAYSRGSRGTKQWEVYENDFYPFFWDCSTNASLIANGFQFDGIKLRGGTGVIFNNRFHGGTWDSSGGPIFFDVERARDANAHTPINTRCSGAVAYDGNSNPGTTYGWPCLDQVGRGFGAATPSGPFTETSLPVLEWGNVKCTGLACTSPVATHPVIDPDSGTRPYQSDVLQNNRDWCQVSSGTCSGTSCSTTCNGVAESYTAYTYPNPIQGPASASLTPSSVAFGNQTVSTSSSGQVVTLTNTGGPTLNISSIAFTGTNAADFSKTTTCGSTLNGGASCTITVTFTPAATGSRSANLVVTDDSGGVGGSTQTTTLTGTGIGAGWTLVQSVWNSSLASFGGTCSFTSATCTIDASRSMVAITPGDLVVATLEQQGSSIAGCGSPSVISSIAGGGGTFVLPTSTQGYNPNHSSAIGYILSATAADTSATVTRSFGYSGAGCNFQVSLREFRPPTGATAALDITGTQASASGTSYNGVGLNLAGSNEVIVQAFSGGAGLASISSPYNSDFNSSDHDGSAGVINTSSGTAPTITSAQAATAIASAAAFTTAFPRAATPVCTPSTGVYNSSQSVSCTDSTPSSFLCGSTDGSTPVTDGVSNCIGSATLITSSRTINVSTTLNVVAGCVGCSDSLVSNNVYTLTSAFASVSPTSLTFPSQATSTSSNIQNIVFTNVGAGGLQLASIGVTGDFSETDNCSRIQGLPSGASCTVSVTFTPTTTGARTGVLTFTDNSTGVIGTTQTVALGGTGVNPPNSGLSFKGNMTFRGNFSIRAQSVTPQTGAPLTYAARTDLTVLGTGATGELLPAACNGNISCLKNAYDSGAATGHQGAKMSYTGGPTSVPPPACRTGGTGAACASSGNNINGLASYLTGANTVNTDPDMGTTIIRATSAEFSGTVQCLGGGLFGSSFNMGTGSSNHWSIPDESGNRKLKVLTTGGSPSILAFNPSTGQVTASDLCGGYFPGGASFSSTDAHIVYTSNADNQENTVPFSSKTGTFITPETINQAVTGAHATLLAINATFVQMGPATGGTADNSHVWTGASSGATFTPNNAFPAPGNNSTSPYAQTIYQGIICDGSAASEESVCLKNPTGTPCAANDTNPTCWYVYWSLIFNYNYVAAMAGDSHFPAASGNCLPAGFDANFHGVFSPSSDSTVFTVAYGDNGQNSHTGYNGGGNATTDNNYSCPNSPGGVCQGPVYLASYKVGSGCRVFNTMTDQITGDWGPTGQAIDQQSFLIPGTVTSTPGPSNVWTQDTTGATTQLLCMRNSSNACATSGWTQAYTGVIYGGSASSCTNSGANASSVWRDSNGASLTPSGCPANAPFLYPDVIHDASQFPNNQLLSYSLVQQPFIKPTGNTAVVYSASAHTTTINYTGGTYSPGQQFIFFNMAGAHDSYLNCISGNQCPVFTAIIVPNTGNLICPGNGPYCPSGANGTITVTDNLGGGSDYTDTESQTGCGKTCPLMEPSPQDQNLLAGGFGGQNYWQTQNLYTAADMKATGHSAAGDHTVIQGKLYAGINAFSPWLPATVPNVSSPNPACSDPVNGYGSPCGSTYPGSLTPTPTNTNVTLLPTTVTDDQHGIWGFAPSELTPPFFVTTLVCGQATTGGVGAAACESQYASVWDSEIIAAENALTRSSPGNLVGADCVYSATGGPVPCIYRIAHTFNTDANWAFSGQNAIANGGITEDGIWIAFPSDWNLTLGCMDLSTTNCWSSWQATAPSANAANLTWSVDGSGNVTITTPNQFCPTSGTQYWYVANPLPPAGNIQSINCGPTAGQITISNFTNASWLNGTVHLGTNSGNAWGCDSTTSNAGNCSAFTLQETFVAHANQSGSETATGSKCSNGLLCIVPVGCTNGIPCQREDIWIAKITSAHQ